MDDETDMQAQVIALLRALGHDDLAEEVITRATGQVRDWYHLKPGDKFLAQVIVERGAPARFVFEEPE